AIVATLDFFTPIVDDPATFGRIAATNAINDVYAMGGTPLLALAVVGYPKDGDLDVLGEILRGGVAAAADHGIGVLGGHPIDDPEPKYGLAVIGRVSPDAVMTNAAGRPGDILVLTKALGTGIAVAAAKASQPGAAHAAAVAQMCVSNRAAAEAAGEVGIRCATDVTGFGLIGHLRELALASGVGAAIRIDKIPPIQGVLELIAEGNLPGAIDRNRAHLEQFVDFDDGVVADARTLLFDPQTSGGLLIACPRADLDHLHDALLARGVRGWPIGQLLPEPAGRIGVISPLTARRAREAPTETRTQS
ncbi:MAG TPA: selenide, water dikinase SelD, partial [Miltoncostaeales bacterium]|nr:selenide, water dikinase SelD [Miltoncostaeales bacterium]